MRIPIVVANPATWSQTNDALQLLEGRVYRTVVQAVNDKNILLNLGGAHVTAEWQGESPLEAGTILWLKTELGEQGEIMLRTANAPSSGNSSSTGSTSATSSLAIANTIVNSLHLKATPTNTKIVRTLLQWFQPVDKETVEQLSSEIRSFPEDMSESYLLARGWSKSTDMDQSRLSVRLVSRFLLGQATPEEVPPSLDLINEAQPQHLTYPDVNVLWWQNEWQHGETYFFEDNNNKITSGGEQNKQVAIRFNTRNLGELWVRIGKQEENIELQVFTEKQHTASLFQGNMQALKHTLQSIGLKLTNATIQHKQPKSFLEVLPPPTVDAEYTGVDFLI